MTPPSQLQLRATDADRERVAEMLRAAAGVGALTVDELETRMAGAYAAVTRADLVALVSDLPPLPAARPPARAPAPAGRNRSLFWLWALLPYLGAAAWVHAAFVTRSARYWRLAAAYAVPLILAIVTAPGADDQAPGWVTGIAVVVWIVNAIHAWTARPAVDAAWGAARAGGRGAGA